MMSEKPTVSNQQSTEQMRDYAEQRRSEIVRDMNAERPAPTMQHVPTPSGTITKEVHTAEAQKKNAEIDQRIEAYKHDLQQARGRARNDFNRSR